MCTILSQSVAFPTPYVNLTAIGGKGYADLPLLSQLMRGW